MAALFEPADKIPGTDQKAPLDGDGGEERNAGAKSGIEVPEAIAALMPKKYKTIEAWAEGHRNLERKLSELTTPPEDYDFGSDVELSFLGDDGVGAFKQALRDARVRGDGAPELAKFVARVGKDFLAEHVREAQRAELAAAWGLDLGSGDGRREFELRGQKILTWAKLELGPEAVERFGSTPVGIMYLERELEKRLDNDRISDVPMSNMPVADDYQRLADMVLDSRYGKDLGYTRKVDTFRQQIEERERLASLRSV